MPPSPDAESERGSSQGSSQDSSGLFRRTLVRVMAVQVLSLLALWLLQSTYAR